MPDTIPPAHLWIPERVGSYGDEAIDLADLAGRRLDAEQRIAVDAMLSYGPGGGWVALEAAVVEARQNGKTSGVILPVVLADLFLFDADRIVWTAHLFRTARDAFNDVCSIIDGTPYLSKRVKKITFANGEEAVELHSGARLEFLARSKGGGRGLGGKRLVMDEALFLSAEAMGALIPTLSAREDPQIVYGSSAGLVTSDHLRNLRNRGRKGGDPSLVWVEWCAPGGWTDPPCELGKKCTHAVGVHSGCALDDEALWPLANPAIGQRITYEFVRAERRALPVEEFGRERMGWWDDPVDLTEQWAVISLTVWSSLADPDTKPADRVGPVCISAETTQDRSVSAIGVAFRTADGLMHVEIDRCRPGAVWVVPRLIELLGKHEVCAVVIDKVGAASSLVDDLEEALKKRPDLNVELVQPTAGQVTEAFGQFFDACIPGKPEEGEEPQEPSVRHLDQAELNAAVAGAQTRLIGDRKAWDRKAGPFMPPLVAVTLAHWGWSDETYDVGSSVY